MTIIKPPQRNTLSMVSLTIPIIIESLFRIIVSSADTIMLSSFSQKAVAAVGMVSQYIFFIQILFNVICIGTSIVLSQYLGAKRYQDAKDVGRGSLLLISLFSSGLCIIVFIGGKPLLSLYAIEPEVSKYAWQYLAIFGGIGSFFTAFSMAQSTILRAYGYTRDAMYVGFLANILNIIGNAISLYGFFGLPVLGVPGVAAASVVAQIASCIVLAIRITAHPEIHLSLPRRGAVPRTIYKTILSVGIPTAGENLSYNVAQIMIMAMVSTFGTNAMSAFVYTQTIARFVFAIPSSIGTAVQIKIGHMVGAGEKEQAYHSLYKYQGIGTAISFSVVV